MKVNNTTGLKLEAIEAQPLIGIRGTNMTIRKQSRYWYQVWLCIAGLDNFVAVRFKQYVVTIELGATL